MGPRVNCTLLHISVNTIRVSRGLPMASFGKKLQIRLEDQALLTLLVSYWCSQLTLERNGHELEC